MTIVVSWVSNEREFSTLWTVADSLLTKRNQSTGEDAPLLECGAKLFSLRISCFNQNENKSIDSLYFTTTIGMAYAGSSLLAQNVNAFLTYTLGNLESSNQNVPSMHDIAIHVEAVFKSILKSYINTNLESTPCEVSVFGYCPRTKKLQLFHIKHIGNNQNSILEEFKFSADSLHLMGNHKSEISNLIQFERSEFTGKKFWRSPKVTIESIIRKQMYNDIGGYIQLGICYPSLFKITPIYDPDLLGKFITGKSELRNIGECEVFTDSIEAC